jgi:transcriptional regulator with GAF, ATPase, and Fis domain/tetratricopeptide (TPR) repeat protein
MERLGRFVVRGELGRGAEAVVYRCWDEERGREVAVKVLPRREGGGAPPREVAALALLDHPGIVPLLETIVEPERLLVVTECVSGADLGRAYEFPLSWEAFWGILPGLLEALDYLHSRGVVHGDLKPSNVLVDRSGRVRLTDFGLARLTAESETPPGLFMGSPGYAAPEVCRGLAPDRRSDLYSLGIMLYELTTGGRPLDGAALWETLRRHLYERPRSPGLLVAGFDPRLEAAILKLLEKDPARRFHSVGDLWRALGPAIPGPLREAFSPALRGGAVLQRPSLSGRGEELTRLLEEVDAAGEGSFRGVVLEGEPGSGRTRLLEELRLRRGWEGPVFLEPPRAARQTPDALAEFIERVRERARTQAVVVLWDDLQEDAPGACAALCARLSDSAPAGTWIFTWRRLPPEEPTESRLDELASAAGLQRIRLGPLPDTAVRALVASALGTRELPEEWLDRVVAGAEGNPLLALEIVRDELDSGALLPRAGAGWIVASPPPPPRRGIAGAPAERALLELIAVAGDSVPEALLHGLDGLEESALLEAVVGLIRRGTLHQTAAGLRFRLPRLREEVLRLTTPERRAALHRFLAAAYERLLLRADGEPDREDPRYAKLIDHKLGGGAGAELIPELIRLAEQERGRGDYRAVLARLQQALRLADEAGEEERRAELLCRCAGLQRLLGDTAAARTSYTAALEAARARGPWQLAGEAAMGLGALAHAAGSLDGAESHFQEAGRAFQEAALARMEGRARLGLGVVHYTRGELHRARPDAMAALERFRGEAAPDEQLRALRLLGDVAYARGEYEAARRFNEEALELAERLDDRAQAASCHGGIGLALLATGRLTEAHGRFAEARRIFAELHHPRGEALALINLAAADLDLGEPRRALEHTDAALKLLTPGGPSQARALALLKRSQALAELGRGAAAAESRSRALTVAEQSGEQRTVTDVLLEIARAARRRGEQALAAQTIAQALQGVDRDASGPTAAQGLLLQGEILADGGAFGSARPLLQGALDTFRKLGDPSGEIQALLELALLELDTPGDLEQALTLLDEAAEIAADAETRRLQLSVLLARCETLARLGRLDQAQSTAGELGRLLVTMDDRATLQHIFFRVLPPDTPLPPQLPELARLVLRQEERFPPPVVVHARATLAAGDPAQRHHYAEAFEHARALPLPRAVRALQAILGISDRVKSAATTPESAGTPTEEPMSDAIKTLLQSATALFQTLDGNALLTTVMDQVIAVTHAERGFLMLRDDQGELRFRVARNFQREQIARPEFATSRSIIEHVAAGNRSFLSADTLADQRFAAQESIQALALRSVLCVPIPARSEPDRPADRAAGVIYVDNPSTRGVFLPSHRMLLEAIAALTSLALTNIQIADQLRETRDLAEQETRRLRRELGRHHRLGRMIGRSTAMQRLFDLIERVAPSAAPVMITGETGTGKELVARTIHFNSPRAEGPFIAINCAALPESLLEAELFGIEKGIATGVHARPGVIEQAHQGTLFLDEIGDMSIAMQAKLLRALQEREVLRVGGRKPIPVDIRVISATNRDPHEEIQAGRFRQDLLYRLNVISLHLPPLRERPDDIPLLAKHFLERFAQEENKELRGFTPETMRRLVSYHWPGNVRELINVIHRAAILETEPLITPRSLPPALHSDDSPAPTIRLLPQGLRQTLRLAEEQLIRQALHDAQGVKKEAARLLGISPRMLSHYLKKHGLNRPR